MNDHRRIPVHEAERGFTLVEVLLVLALLAIITAMVWPSLQKPFTSYRIRVAADAVRTKWCQARIAAMQSGHTYLFRYTVGGDQFSVEPEEESDALLSSSPAATGNSTTGVDGLGTPREGAALPHEEGTLPEGIRFLADNTAGSDPAALGLDQQTDPLADPGGDQSTAILFYPDGTTSNARLLLADERDRALRLTLRGLTGTVTVSDALVEESR